MSFLNSINVKPKSLSWLSAIELAGKECPDGFVIVSVIPAPQPENMRSLPSNAQCLLPSCPRLFLLLASVRAQSENRVIISPKGSNPSLELFFCTKPVSENRKKMGEPNRRRTSCHGDWCPLGGDGNGCPGQVGS